MGYTSTDVYAKTLVSEANVPLLGLLHLFSPHAGLAGKAFVTAVRTTWGGLWVDGRASVVDGQLRFVGTWSGALVIAQHVAYAVSLRSTRVTVQQALTGGLAPTSRLIIVQHTGGEVRLATPRGGGEALGAAAASWAQ
jgi:hypothetical protein